MINLRTYSKYSIKYSVASIENIVANSKLDKDTHVAILDRKGLHSTIYLAKEAKRAGLEPMMGYELREWLTLWPTTHKGLRCLNRIATLESKEQSSSHIFDDIIAIFNPSIALIGNDYNNCQNLINLFGKDNLFIEIEERTQQQVKDVHIKLAKENGLKIIATSVVRYNTQQDALAHDYFHNYVIGDGVHLNSDTFYIKSEQDFLKWAEPEWIQNAKDLAKRVKLDIVLGKLRLPEFSGAPDNLSNFDYLVKKCREALHSKRLTKGWHHNDDYEVRLDTELSDIKDAHLESYFLIVEDIITWARTKGIKVGRGRGSGAGSLVCYLLGITGIDPLKYGLIWERFYNAGRAGSLPDIDTDFEKGRRQEVIDYITQRWGKDNVFQIITFGSFGPAKAITVALNIAQCGFEEQKEISKLVHHKAETIKDAIERSPELKEEANRRKALFQIAEKLEGSLESFGKHAAGVIIANEPFTNGGLPMTWHAEDAKYISGYDLGAIEEYGLLKLDALGLNTLDIIKECEELIRKRHNPSFKIDEVPQDDIEVYKNIFDTGMTKGIFQLESQLGQKYSKLLKPRTISEIADLVTVVRPGAMEPGQTQQYLDVRDGKKKPSYPHPKLEKILGYTYSACIYQEQVMHICTEIAGLDLQQADTIRKAAGKKKPELMAKQKDMFLQGCSKEGVTPDVSEVLWSWIVEFSGYGFNKSHAIGYAHLTYDTAWLKHHYPLEFFVASCNNVRGDIHRSEHDKLREFIYDAKEFDIQIILPSLKHCNEKFEIINDKTIRYGLSSIKDIGDSQIALIDKCKNETDFHAFLSKALSERINKKVIKALICSGALDELKLTRNTMLADYELIDELTDREYSSLLEESKAGLKIFDIIREMCDESKVDERKSKSLISPNKTRRQKLRDIIQNYKSKDKFESILHIAMYEREFLGCDISVNETDSVFSTITHNLLELKKLNYKIKNKVRTAIHIDSIRKTVTKTGKNPGQEMAFITGSDGTAIYDSIVVFPRQFQTFKNLLTEGRVVYIDGETSQSGGLIVNNMGILK